jgi:hypothetical protein
MTPKIDRAYHFVGGAALAILWQTCGFQLAGVVAFVAVAVVLLQCLSPHILWNKRCVSDQNGSTMTYRRHKTYPAPVPNTWYHLLDSNEVLPGKVHHLRVIGKSLAVWRTEEGVPIVMDATCPHMGANLAVGGA